ncbi:MAG: DUF5702 domain-containing protein [Eubacteriales bacterium]|nr:DUF5702 domain-containing protein [Eubacteriales bacterium]
MSGQITVFFALTLTVVCALLLGMVESARTQGARLYFTQAVNSSIDSLFSQYHRKLWKDYRLLGLEHYSDEQLFDEMEQFITPYFEASDWYPEKVREFTVREKYLLTDFDGELFEKEVLEYMKYGVWSSLWDYATAETMLREIGEAGALDRISDLYEGHSKEAARLEEAIEAIVGELDEQKRFYEEALSAVEALSGSRFIRAMRDMKRSLSRLPEKVQNYEEKADRLAEALSVSRSRYEEEKEALSESVRQAMEADIREYEAYVEKNGIRRMEIAGFPARAEANQRFLDEVIADAEEVEDYISSWEPEDEDDELDEEALWSPVRARFLRYDLLSFGGAGGIADKEKEGFLEGVGNLISGNFLELVLPEGADVSKAKLPLTDSPSLTSFSGTDGCRLSLSERVLMGEYTLKVLHYFGRDLYGSHPETKGSGGLEVEYVLNGKETDYENLADTAMRILALREGMNLIYLFSDSEKRAEARTLAFTITGAAGFTPLITVMTFFILGVWALGQAICDVKDLLAGKKVPFLHGRDSFYLSLQGLLMLGQTGRVTETAAGDRGLPYREYLRILLFKNQSSLYEYRIMDMIQMNVKSSQQDFLLDRCIYSLAVQAEAETKHVLASMGMLAAYLPIEKMYTIQTETGLSY